MLTKKGALPALNYTSDTEFNGGGTINNAETITAQVSVRVVDVLPNGNMVVEGNLRTSFSGEKQDAVVRGLVRPDERHGQQHALQLQHSGRDHSIHLQGHHHRCPAQGLVHQDLGQSFAVLRTNMRRTLQLLAATWLAGFACAAFGSGVRVKDIALISGVRDNQLSGYGLVVGLAGEGDKNPVQTLQTVANILQRFGLTVPATTLTAKNVAIVIVTADIPAFKKTGTRLDVNVASMGDAKTLQGGVLLQTPLLGADGKVYAVAQGPAHAGRNHRRNRGRRRHRAKEPPNCRGDRQRGVGGPGDSR